MYKRILVPTDGSDITAKAVQTAITLAKTLGAQPHVSLRPPDDLVQSWALDRRSKQHLTTRHSMLSTQCTAPPAADN